MTLKCGVSTIIPLCITTRIFLNAKSCITDVADRADIRNFPINWKLPLTLFAAHHAGAPRLDDDLAALVYAAMLEHHDAPLRA